MFRRVVVGAALLATVAIGARAESLMDYKNVSSEKVIAEAVADISGDDVEGRRAASDRILALLKAQATVLGSDVLAEATFSHFAEGMVQLVQAGKATSRIRAERLMEEAFSSLGEVLKSSDTSKVESAARALASINAVIAKNPDNPTLEKFTANIKELFTAAGIDPETIPVAPEAPAKEEKPRIAGAEAAPDPVIAAAPEKAVATPPATVAEPVATPTAPSEPAPVAAAPAPQISAPPVALKVEPTPTPTPAPVPVPEVQTILVAVPPPPPPKPRTADFPLTPVAAVKSALYADNPAYKVTTVIAPPRSRPGYREEQAKAEEKIRKKLAFLEADEPNASLINIILDQLKSQDPKRIDSGLKLTSRVSEIILAARAKDLGSNATTVLSRTRELLGHPEGRVKRSAALAATALKDKLAVRPLIDLLKNDEEATVSTARAALYSIVGIDLGLNQRPWLDWAAMNQPR